MIEIKGGENRKERVAENTVGKIGGTEGVAKDIRGSAIVDRRGGKEDRLQE